MEELEVLTKRFKDYIDKVQVTLDKAEKVIPKLESSEIDSSDKFYTVVSPADVMTNNLKTVLKALDKAIVNIDEMSTNAPSEDALIFADAVASSGEENNDESQVSNRIFSSDELEFLEKTFNKILNASDKERNRIFEDLDKIGNS